jgi:uncharacterized membrane protein (DUF373 family)
MLVYQRVNRVAIRYWCATHCTSFALMSSRQVSQASPFITTKAQPMPDFEISKKSWKDLTPYGLFERITSLVVMFFVSVIIVYSLILMAIDLYEQFWLGLAFIESESLRDVFGSILTILILIEFNHSIVVAISTKAGILQARPIVLITILVIARKVILLDFKTATFEQMLAISALAVAFGLLYWLMTVRPSDTPSESKSTH